MRLFLAYDPDKNAIEQIMRIQNDFYHSLPANYNIRVTEIQNIHLTVKFIGDYPDSEDIINCVSSCSDSTSRKKKNYRLKIKNITGFPRLNSAKVIALECENSLELIKEVELLENKLYSLGIEKEKRKFFPHITIARCREPIALEKREIEEFSAGFSGLRLYQSILDSKGARYKLLKEFF